MRLLFLGWILLAGFQPLAAESLLPKKVADSLLNEAGQISDPVRAGALYLEAAEAYNTAKMGSEWAYAIKMGAWKTYQASGADQAIHVLRTALEAPSSPKDSSIRSGLLLNLAYWQERGNQFADAGKTYEEAIAIYPSDEPESKLAQNAYRPLGNIYTRLGEYEKARFFLEKAFFLFQKEQSPGLIASVANDLSIAEEYSENQEAAFAWLKKGYAARPEGKDLALLFAREADLFMINGQYSQALQKAKQAISILQKEDTDLAREYLAGCYEKIGAIYRELDIAAQAHHHFQLSEETFISVLYSPYHRQISKLRIQRAELFQEEGNLSSSIAEYQRALQAVLPDFQPETIDELPERSSFYAENSISEALSGKGKAYRIRWEQDGNKSDLTLAMKCFLDAIYSDEYLQQLYELEASRLSLREYLHALYEEAILTAFLLYQQSGDEDWKEEAFLLSERSKAALLLLGFREARAMHNLPLDEAWEAEEQEVLETIRDLQAERFEWMQTDDPSKDTVLLEIQEEIFVQQQKLDSLRNILQSSYPGIYQHTYHSDPVPLEKIQAQLASGQSLISFFSGSQNGFVFVLNRNSLHLSSIAADSVLGLHIRQLGQSLLASEKWSDIPGNNYVSDSFVQHANWLYRNLIQPIESGLKHELVIIPDGSLGNLPFGVLLSNIPQEGTYRADFPWLIRQHPVSYAYSSSLWYENHQDQENEPGLPFAIFSPDYRNIASIAPLQMDLVKARQISDEWDGRVFFGKDASRSQFLREAENYQIIQFSGHGFVNRENPMFSGLIFAGENSGPTEAEYLYQADLFGMRIPAELVVLSACETGIGKSFQGEGAISLSRSFAAAGSQSVFTTLWKVEDTKTSQITQYFYQYLREGKNKSEALQLAALQLIGEDSSPYFWAGCILYGNESPLNQQHWFENKLLWFLLAAGCLGLIFTVLRLTAAGRKSSSASHST